MKKKIQERVYAYLKSARNAYVVADNILAGVYKEHDTQAKREIAAARATGRGNAFEYVAEDLSHYWELNFEQEKEYARTH